MQNTIYLLSAVAALCGMYFVWSLGIRNLLLDQMRERVFKQRFELFRLGMNGEVDFDDEAYRALETLFNGLLRFGHRITFLTYLFSRIAIARAEKEKDYVSVSAQIALRISRLRPEAQAKVAEILQEVHSAALIYTAVSSLFFLSIAMVLLALSKVGLVHLDEKAAVARESIEREAYLAESRRGIRLAAA